MTGQSPLLNDNSKQAILQREQQFCPFIGRQCNKPRKSEPEVKVGICSLGYKNFDNDFEPFSGTGSTVEAAVFHGRYGIGYDISAQYTAFAEKRLQESTR